MCFKKEYKCYKCEGREDCCQKRVDEAVSHRTNFIILIIAVALIILALTVKTADSEIFSEQVSFASTVTSIVLSVIAIWMSITGERSTNAIKEKVSSSVDKLTETTNKSIDLSDDLKKTLDNQNSKYDEIIEKMEEVISNVEGMKESVVLINDSLLEYGNIAKSGDKYLDEESIEKMVNNTMNCSDENTNAVVSALLKKGMAFVYDQRKAKQKVLVRDLKKYLETLTTNENASFATGILVVFSKCGVFEKMEKEKFGI